MVKAIKKAILVILTAALALSVWSVPVWAQDSAEVTFKLSSGIELVSGDTSWSGESDYVATFDIPDNFVFCYAHATGYCADDSTIGLVYTFDEQTGEFTIPAEGFSSEYIECRIYIQAYDPEHTYDVDCELPDGVSIKEGSIGENAGKISQDYSLTFSFSGDARLVVEELYCYSSDSSIALSYTFDETTKTLTIGSAANLSSFTFCEAQTVYIRMTVTDDFDYSKNVKSVTLPFETNYKIDGKKVDFYIDGSFERHDAEFYEVELEKDDNILYKVAGDDIDTYVFVLRHIQDGEFECIDYIDNDVIDYGESGIFTAPDDGKYIFVASCYDDDVGENVSVLLEKVGEALPPLDFTGSELPTDTEQNSWDYDAASKTLTLKDGFSINTMECAISLPDGATVVVEGEALISVIDFASYAICAQGDLNIELSEGAKLDLKSGIYSPAGTVTVNGIAGADGLPSLFIDSISGIKIGGYTYHSDEIEGKTNAVIIKNADITIEGVAGIDIFNGCVEICDSIITMDTDDECIIADYLDEPDDLMDVTIKNSKLDLSSGEEVIQNYIGDIILENCSAVLYSDDEEGLYSDYSIIISGGSLDIDTPENCLETVVGEIVLENVKFRLFFNNTEGEYDIINSYDVSIDGIFAVYDKNMQPLYQGSFTEEIKQMFENIGAFDFVDDNGSCIYPMLVTSMIIPSSQTSGNDTQTGGEVIITPDGEVLITPDKDNDTSDNTESDNTASDSDTTDNTASDDEDTNPDMGSVPSFSLMLLAACAVFAASKKRR